MSYTTPPWMEANPDYNTGPEEHPTNSTQCKVCKMVGEDDMKHREDCPYHRPKFLPTQRVISQEQLSALGLTEPGWAAVSFGDLRAAKTELDFCIAKATDLQESEERAVLQRDELEGEKKRYFGRTLEHKSPEHAVRLLNELFKLDPAFMKALLVVRVPVNDAIVGHPTVQVAKGPGDGCVAGILGILNGIFGCDGDDRGYIAMTYNDETTELEGFTVLLNTKD